MGTAMSDSASPRTLALSDCHLGRAGSTLQAPEDLAPLVQGFERVLLLGDIVDHWYLDEAQALAMEDRVEAVCRKQGVKDIVWFRGNHDATRSHGEEFALFGETLYLHGHALYSRLGRQGDIAERVRTLNARKYGPHKVGSRANGAHWALLGHAYDRIPQKLAAPIAWNPLLGKRIERFAREASPGANVRAVVFGHTHCPGVRRFGGVTAFNLGGWMKNTRPCAFVHKNKRLRLKEIEHRRGGLRLGRKVHEMEL